MSYARNGMDVEWDLPEQLVDLNPAIKCPSCSSQLLEWADEGCDACGHKLQPEFWQALTDTLYDVVYDCASSMGWTQGSLTWCCNKPLGDCSCRERMTFHTVQAMLDSGAVGYAPDSYCSTCKFAYTAFCPMLRAAGHHQVAELNQLDEMYRMWNAASWNDLLPVAIDGCSIVPNLIESEIMDDDEIKLDADNLIFNERARNRAMFVFEQNYVPPTNPFKMLQRRSSANG
jgi:hypothetical protein